MINLDNRQKEVLYKALFFLNIKELKEICHKFEIPTKGDKRNLIENIKSYLNTGEIPKIKEIPEISKAKTKTSYPLSVHTLILLGSYKNDLKTRIFFKSIIGKHFHYTSYGMDWLKHKWSLGQPPTYAEFAKYWQEEFLQRQKNKAELKPEWAYLSFLARYKKEYPNASKTEAISAWHKFREKQIEIAKRILSKL